jgi:dienelactone hydrolase
LLFLAVLNIAGMVPTANAADQMLGGFGPEGPRMREQLWVVPSTDAAFPLRATLFRPQASAAQERFPLVIINHGTDETTRQSVSMPVYYWLSRWFIEHGYAVFVPQRRGHGATGGAFAEGGDTCARPDHVRSGMVAAQDLAAAMRFMRAQSFIDPDNIVVVGVSTGGWATLALSAIEPYAIRATINFAGGRGGHAYGKRNAVCMEVELIRSAGLMGRTARAPSLWFYSRNDSYFGPKLAEDMARAWSEAGGFVEPHILPPYGDEGHSIADDRAGWELWGPDLQRFLARLPAHGDWIARAKSAPVSGSAAGELAVAPAAPVHAIENDYATQTAN